MANKIVEEFKIEHEIHRNGKDVTKDKFCKKISNGIKGCFGCKRAKEVKSN